MPVIMGAMSEGANITADAAALQERDAFSPRGWVKVIAPAKVNLHLAIGARREDGYHDAVSIMHALNLHDIVYVRRAIDALAAPSSTCALSSVDVPGADTASLAGPPGIGASEKTANWVASCRMVATGGFDLPDLPARDNLAAKAVARLAEAIALPADAGQLDIRIEKNIPSQAGLGGGSSDAAAALVGAAKVWGIDAHHPAIEETARTLGADVAFFLHGGCAYLEGTGDTFAHALAPSKRSVALVKPAGGVSTAEAYRRFDEHPTYIDANHAAQAQSAKAADEIELYNNLAPASEELMPQLAEIRAWLSAQPQVEGVLLCGSGATTFAICTGFDATCAVVAAARERGWWARSTSFGSIRAVIVSGGAA